MSWFDDLLGSNLWVAGKAAVSRGVINAVNFLADDNPGQDRYDLSKGLGLGPVPSIKFWWQDAPAINADRYTNTRGILSAAARPAPVPGVGFILNTLTWVCTGNPLITDTTTLTVMQNGAPTALTLVIPAGTALYTPVVVTTSNVFFSGGDTFDLRIRQNGTTARLNWYSQVLVGGV
jgi:hypothetical protein